jgi:hypothetical protein
MTNHIPSTDALVDGANSGGKETALNDKITLLQTLVREAASADRGERVLGSSWHERAKVALVSLTGL